nr:hypothetical protein [uncultured Flavobacterium sp.]
MIPKKKSGFRKIEIDGVAYHWRFSEIIQIRPLENPYNNLEVAFGYFDPWLYSNDKENTPADFEPKIITPGFIKSAIQNAIQLGWDNNVQRGNLKLNYANGTFTVTPK